MKTFVEAVNDTQTISMAIDGQDADAHTERKFTHEVTKLPDYETLVVRELRAGFITLTKLYLNSRFKGDRDKVREMFKQIWN